jgi:prepilin-type N-terminal cleavage/methylation domain-containing protein
MTTESTMTGRLKARAGFTLVEVIVASVILAGALIAMAGFTMRYQQIDSRARQTARASQAASDRLELVRSTQPYFAMDTMQAIETNVPGLPGFSRRTWVTRVGGTASDTVDYRVITVRVAPPGISLSEVAGGTQLAMDGSTGQPMGEGGGGRNIGESVGQIVQKTTIVGAF